jgi:hypothetical protein
MANTGEAQALNTLDLPVLKIGIKDGQVSDDPVARVMALASQRIVLENLDNRNYRLRLRRTNEETVVGACIHLTAGQTAEFIIEPNGCDAASATGNVAYCEILGEFDDVSYGIIKGPIGPPKYPSPEVLAAGIVKGPVIPPPPPRFEFLVVNYRS